MKASVWIGALAALAFASAAHAAPNPFYDAYRGDIAVADVSVTYADGILESHSDRAASSFVANAFSPELRAAFEATTAASGVTDESYAERLSEFLLARSLRTHGAELTGTRRVRLDINVTDARINGLMSGALFGGGAFPRLAGDVRIFDAESGALLATAAISNSQSSNMHNELAEQTHGFRYNFSGTDTNFRLLAGSTEAFRINVVEMLTAPSFPERNDRTVVSTYPRIAIIPPVFDVTLAAQQ